MRPITRPRVRPRLVATLAGCLLFAGCAGIPQNPTSAAPPRAGTVVVQRGDTLYSIAFRNGLNYHDLAAWNRIGPKYTIYPGQRLRLTPPRAVAAPVSTPAPKVSAPKPPPPAAQRAPQTTPAPLVTTPAPLPAPAAVSSGGWQWPTQGRVVTRFDPPTDKGINIAGRYGQEVVAAAPGEVVYSGNALKGYGELVIVKHAGDFLSAYGFNSRRLVSEGQQVAAGQLIAQMGEGPGQTAELHFEIRYKGQPVDPLKYLPAR